MSKYSLTKHEQNVRDLNSLEIFKREEWELDNCLKLMALSA